MKDTQDVKFETVREVAQLVRDFIVRRYGDSGGLCIDATRYIMRLLNHRGIETTCYEGKVRFTHEGVTTTGYHVWLEVDDVIVDVTADQFNDEIQKFPPVLIGMHAEWPQFEGRRGVAFHGDKLNWMEFMEPPVEIIDVGPLECVVG